MTIYRIYVTKRDTNVSYSAHIAGAMAGLLLGLALLENRRVVRWEVKLKKVTVSLYFLLLLAGVLWHIVSDITSFILSNMNNSSSGPVHSILFGTEKFLSFVRNFLESNSISFKCCYHVKASNN